MNIEKLEHSLGLDSIDELLTNHAKSMKNVAHLLEPKELLIRQTGRTTRIIVKGIMAALEGKRVFFRAATIHMSQIMCNKAHELAKRLNRLDLVFEPYTANAERGVSNAVILYDHEMP